MKTLKDITEKELEGYKGLIFKDDLKAEAVVRWKIAKEKFDIAINHTDKMYYTGRMSELEDLFELTKEDLK